MQALTFNKLTLEELETFNNYLKLNMPTEALLSLGWTNEEVIEFKQEQKRLGLLHEVTSRMDTIPELMFVTMCE